MELVGFLGNDKESWGQITALINRGEWEKVILIKNKNAESYPASANCTIIEVNCDKPLIELKEEIMNKLKDKMGDLEVALSIASGNGKEHMAVISALLSVPVGIRLVVFTKNGVEFIN